MHRSLRCFADPKHLQNLGRKSVHAYPTMKNQSEKPKQRLKLKVWSWRISDSSFLICASSNARFIFSLFNSLRFHFSLKCRLLLVSRLSIIFHIRDALISFKDVFPSLTSGGFEDDLNRILGDCLGLSWKLDFDGQSDGSIHGLSIMPSLCLSIMPSLCNLVRCRSTPSSISCRTG
jgi:hypothetical protein